MYCIFTLKYLAPLKILKIHAFFFKITVQIVIACKKILSTQRPSNISFFGISSKETTLPRYTTCQNVLLDFLIYEILLQFLLLANSKSSQQRIQFRLFISLRLNTLNGYLLLIDMLSVTSSQTNLQKLHTFYYTNL